MDIALKYDPQQDMLFDLLPPENGDLAKQTSLETAVTFSLFCDRRADPSDSLLDPSDRRGWCMDGTDGDPEDQWGSRLWQIYGRALSGDILTQVKVICEEALQWMVDDGVVAEVLVTTEIVGYQGAAAILGIGIILREASGNEIMSRRFDTLWKELRDAV